MEQKPTKEEIAIRAFTKAVVYVIRDGYIPDKNGIEKKRDIKEFLSPKEYMAVEPYIDQIIDIALGYQYSNEIRKPRNK